MSVRKFNVRLGIKWVLTNPLQKHLSECRAIVNAQKWVCAQWPPRNRLECSIMARKSVCFSAFSQREISPYCFTAFFDFSLIGIKKNRPKMRKPLTKFLSGWQFSTSRQTAPFKRTPFPGDYIWSRFLLVYLVVLLEPEISRCQRRPLRRSPKLLQTFFSFDVT